MYMKYLLEVKDLKKDYEIRKGIFKRRETVHAVKNISFKIHRGQIVGLAGESGSGKTTVAKIITKIEAPTCGSVQFNGVRIDNIKEREFLKYRTDIQMIFQNPFASMNPKLKLKTSLLEAPVINKLYLKKEAQERLINFMKEFDLKPEILKRFPGEVSGGELQRLSIIRALSVNPKFLIADEIVSALDVPVQIRILKLLKKLQKNYKLSILFISHDLSVIKNIADRVVILKNGNIVEENLTEKIFLNPEHEYTRQLVNSVPSLNGLCRNR